MTGFSSLPDSSLIDRRRKVGKVVLSVLLPRAGDEKGAHMVPDQGGVSPIELKKGVRVGVEVPEGGTYVAVIEPDPGQHRRRRVAR